MQKTKYNSTNLPYGSVYEIENTEFRKHEKRVHDLEKNVRDNMAAGKATSYEEECFRLTNIQTKKITDPKKAYGRFLVAEDLRYYDIAKVFLSKYKFLTQTRGERLSSLLDEL